MTYAHRLVEIQVRGVLIVVILNGNKHWMSINLCCRSGVEPIAPNVLQLNADFVLHKICDLGAVIRSVCVGGIN